MWDKIAVQTLGSSTFTDALMRANSQYVDVYIFSSGVVLTIPRVDELMTADDLPPWKQVEG
jgi:hypothetical protein